MGGFGAGMICLDGAGALSKFSLHHRPDVEREHHVFAAVSFKGAKPYARLLEGPVPTWKIRPQFPGPDGTGCWGLPRYHRATMEARFPFATVQLTDDEVPLAVSLTGWSPFSPGDADSASLPVAGLEYRFDNRSQTSVEGVFSFNAENFMADAGGYQSTPISERLDRIRPTQGGFILYGPGAKDRPTDEGSCAVWVREPNVEVNHAWLLDSLDLLWRELQGAAANPRMPSLNAPSAGASLFVPLTLAPGEARTITVYLAWYVPKSDLYEPEKGFREGKQIDYPKPIERYRPWYAAHFSAIADVISYWQDRYETLKEQSNLFARTLQDSTLPPEVLEAVIANLSILKSTTVLRQADGRLWGWEGSYMESSDDRTGVSGTSTHVWNYAQSIAHLFPDLERGLRETELTNNQNKEGLQYCRTPLPIRPVEAGHTFPDGPAADGQLGGIIKVYREWRISGDTDWMRRLWPRVQDSLNYCIRTWDPDREGWLKEPHLTTYDQHFWGADSLCMSLYLGALKAGILMGQSLNESTGMYRSLLEAGVRRMETLLFNGEYFFQAAKWTGLRTPFPPRFDLIYGDSPGWLDYERKEGPPGQYGTGCLSDGVFGVWLGLMSGLEAFIETPKVESHLLSVYRYNFKTDLTDHANLLRADFACNEEPGLLLCTWPRGGRPPLPILYSDEVWTGLEYQVASHLIAIGKISEGLDIVRSCRQRYDGRVRNPFSEVEAGHWYARAMSSYALLQALSGARFDAVDKVLHLKPRIKGDFRCFLSTATGYGTVGVRHGLPFLEVVAGHIPYAKIDYVPASSP